MKRILGVGLIMICLLYIGVIRPLPVLAESSLRIEGPTHHVIVRGETIDYTKELRIVGDGSEHYSSDDILVDDSQVNVNRTGVYVVTYFLRQTDVTARGYVVVIDPVQPDDTKPTIEGAEDFDILLGAQDVDLLRETVAFDGKQDITDRIIIDDSGIDYNTPSDHYTLYYYVSDRTGNVAVKSVIVRVIETDDVKPTFIGVKDLTVDVNESVDLLKDVSAKDNVSGNLTDVISVDDSKLDIHQLGTYPVTYRVTDEAGNEATETIMVSVVDRKAPIIQMKHDLRFKIGSTPQYQDFFTITDNYDRFEDLTINIDASAVDLFSVGSYEITVTVTDSHNNIATKTFLIYIYYSEDTLWNNPFLLGAIIAVISSFIVNAGYYFYYKKKLFYR